MRDVKLYCINAKSHFVFLLVIFEASQVVLFCMIFIRESTISVQIGMCIFIETLTHRSYPMDGFVFNVIISYTKLQLQPESLSIRRWLSKNGFQYIKFIHYVLHDHVRSGQVFSILIRDLETCIKTDNPSMKVANSMASIRQDTPVDGHTLKGRQIARPLVLSSNSETQSRLKSAAEELHIINSRCGPLWHTAETHLIIWPSVSKVSLDKRVLWPRPKASEKI